MKQTVKHGFRKSGSSESPMARRRKIGIWSLVIGIFSFIFLLLAFTGEARAGSLIYGDAQRDGNVDVTDKLRIRQNAGGLPGVPLRGNADASGHDCRLVLSDAMAISQYMVGFRSDLPVFIPSECWAFKLTATNGDGQEGPPNQSLPQPLEVTLENLPTCTQTISGCTLGGVTITYEITSDSTGGAILTGGLTTLDKDTDSFGKVSTELTLGPSAGAVTVVASIDLYRAEGGLLVTVSATFTAATIECGIDSVMPTTGCSGFAVTISGSYFGPNPGTVNFDSTGAAITSWGDTSIIVEAPGGDYSDMTVTPTAGNSCGLAGTYSYDMVAGVTITSPADGVTVTAGDVSVTGTADTDITTVSLGATEGTWTDTNPAVSGGSWSSTLQDVPSGSPVTITATGTDDCGNIGNDSVMVVPFLPTCIWDQSNWDWCKWWN